MMTRRRALDLLCLVAMVAALVAGRIPRVLPIATLAVLLGHRLFFPSWKGALPGARLGETALAAGFFAATIFRLGGLDLFAALHGFALPLLLLWRLSQPTGFQDFLVFLVSLLALGAAVVATPGLVALGLIVLYVFCAVFAVPQIAPRLGGPEGDVRVQLSHRPRLWSAAIPSALFVLAVGALGGGGLLYLLVPRFAGDVDESPIDEALADAGGAGDRLVEQPRRRTGFPSRVQLGDVGAIKKDPRVAFRATLLLDGQPANAAGDRAHWRLLRVRSWSLYDAPRRSWMEPARDYRPPAWGRRRPNGDPRIRWDIDFEEYDRPQLFVPQLWEELKAVPGRRSVATDGRGNVRATTAVRSYSVLASVPPSEESLQRALVDRSDPDLLAVPPEMARKLDRYLPVSRGDAVTDVEAIRAVRKMFLQGDFRYVLNPPAGVLREQDPILAFLERKTGHCELYASAACLLLRRLGIPTRLVAGVRCRQPQAPGRFEVRYEQAHAWVEVPFRNLGFLGFDVTPPDSSAGRRSMEAPVTPAEEDVPGEDPVQAQVVDWEQPLEYGREEQRRIYEWLSKRLESIPWIPLGAGLFAVLFLLGLKDMKRRKRTKARAFAKARSSEAFYTQWLRTCARAGHRRRPWQTPREFLHGLPAEFAGSGDEITRRFERVRYRTNDPS